MQPHSRSSRQSSKHSRQRPNCLLSHCPPTSSEQQKPPQRKWWHKGSTWFVLLPVNYHWLITSCFSIPSPRCGFIAKDVDHSGDPVKRHIRIWWTQNWHRYLLFADCFCRRLPSRLRGILNSRPPHGVRLRFPMVSYFPINFNQRTPHRVR